MKIYIAGPMTGIPKFNYPAFMLAEVELQSRGYEVLNPARINEVHNPERNEQDWKWYMRHAIRMVLDADAISLLKGWEDSKGARLERTIANNLDLHIRLHHDWLYDSKQIWPQEKT